MLALQSTDSLDPALMISIVSLIVGAAGFTLSILNYRRDHHKVTVRLQWDSGYSGPIRKPQDVWGEIYVTNEGRRPISITFVGLEIPGKEFSQNLIGDEEQPVRKLAEGDSPIRIKVPQDYLLKKHSGRWREIRAVAMDSVGRTYISKQIKHVPTWARSNP
jgi:hypothetical protein